MHAKFTALSVRTKPFNALQYHGAFAFQRRKSFATSVERVIDVDGARSLLLSSRFERSALLVLQSFVFTLSRGVCFVFPLLLECLSSRARLSLRFVSFASQFATLSTSASFFAFQRRHRTPSTTFFSSQATFVTSLGTTSFRRR